MGRAKDVIKKLLLLSGFEIHKREAGQRCSLKGVLLNLKANGFEPATVIDGGAAFGSWSWSCAEVFPNATYLLIEPLFEYEQALQQVVSSLQHATLLRRGISNTSKETTIYVHPDLVGSSLKIEYEPHNQAACTERIIPCETLDSLCGHTQLQAPFLLKLDIQGAEREALMGGTETLRSTQALIMETSLIECIHHAGRFDEIIQFLSQRGFVVYDLFGHNYRPYDQALAQVDILFVPESSPLRSVPWYANEQQRSALNKKFQNQKIQQGL